MIFYQLPIRPSPRVNSSSLALASTLASPTSDAALEGGHGGGGMVGGVTGEGEGGGGRLEEGRSGWKWRKGGGWVEVG